MALHVFPAIILDTALRVKGNKPQILKLYRMVESFGYVISFFISSTFKFDNKNMKRVCNRYGKLVYGLHFLHLQYFSMTLEDKKTFPCDFGQVNWPEYRDIYIYTGISATLLGDKSDRQTLKRNSNKMKILHYSAVVIFYCVVAFFGFMVLKRILL